MSALAVVPTLPRLADILAAEPFTARRQLADAAHAAAATWFQHNRPRFLAIPGATPKAWERLEQAWGLARVQALLRAEPRAYQTADDLAAFLDAVEAARPEVATLNDAGSPPEVPFADRVFADRVFPGLLDAVGEKQAATVRTAENVAGWYKPAEDHDPDADEPLGGFERVILNAVWRALPMVGNGGMIPPHPTEPGRYFDASLAELRRFVAVLRQPANAEVMQAAPEAIAATVRQLDAPDSVQPAAAEEMPPQLRRLLSKRRDEQLKLAAKLWPDKCIPHRELKRHVYGNEKATDEALKQLVHRTNKKLGEYSRDHCAFSIYRIRATSNGWLMELVTGQSPGTT